MQIAKDVAVKLAYTLHNEGGDLIDEGTAEEPLWYLHGHGNLLPSVEKELAGLEPGAKTSFVVAPEDGYGVRDDEAVQVVEKAQLPPGMEVEVGMELVADMGAGPAVVRVTAVADDTFTLDLNHPLADVELHFAFEVLETRAAEKDEIAHGHVNAPGHHHH